MAGLSFDELKSVVENISDKLDCPVCFEGLKPPVSQCLNGHGVCSDCRPKLNHCPVCTERFLTFKNRLLDDVLGLLPHKCKFDGCQETVKPGDDHEKWCGQQPTTCKMCSWKGSAKTIFDHVKKDHAAFDIMNESNHITLDNFSNSSRCIIPILAHRNFFWMVMDFDSTKNKFQVKFNLVPKEKLKDSFQMKMVLEDSKKYYAATITLTADSALSANEHDISCTLQYSAVKDFLNSEGSLPYRLYVNKNPRPPRV